MQASFRASDFIDSFGVNAHLQIMDSKPKTAATLNALAYLGLDMVRSPVGESLLWSGSVANKLAQAGIEFNVLTMGVRSPADTIASIASFAKANPGAVVSIEGPNEINNWPISYKGLGGIEAGVAFVNDLAAEIRGNAALAHVDIFDLSGAGRSPLLSSDASGFVNIHPYPQKGDQPYDRLEAAVGNSVVAGKGVVITEAGYHTAVGNTKWEGVDELTQAKLTLNLMADATRLGVAKTFLYQLNDYADPKNLSVDKNLGLFDNKFQPKLAATAIHNLTSILADKGVYSEDFTTHALDYSLAGLPESGNALLLEKSMGQFDLMVWAEPDIWDQAANKAITVAAEETQIDLGGRRADIRIFDPLVSDKPIAAFHDVTVASFMVADHPVIVEIVLLDGPAVEMPSAALASPQWLKGTMGADRLVGGNGNDRLIGRDGDDVLIGGDGNDQLTGGAGMDKMTGGRGADLFIYKGAPESRPLEGKRDQIMDFNAAEGDRIDLSAIDANSKLKGDQAFILGSDHFTRQAGELIQTAHGDGMLVQGDQNGDGKADFQILLHDVLYPLAESAFIL